MAKTKKRVEAPGDKRLLGAAAALRSFALTKPDASASSPWGGTAIKVGKRSFLGLGFVKRSLRVTVKLPDSGLAALTLPFAEPTHHGLGKSGWVTATFDPGEEPPLKLLRSWIEESYRAMAPKGAKKKPKRT
jgi:predicted DNA-binding protein (MmcQ/YjbR family)